MTIILIGASSNPEKYGNKILHHLLLKDKNVIPINPNFSEINGIKCFSNLGEIAVEYEKIIFVINPQGTLNILKEYQKKLFGKKLWFQPGSYNEEILDFCKKNNFTFEAKNCILKL